ncbi:hypothetical protein F2P79_009257 [Pimephales promelas]|nr:hypothetical protein F2P79_009257 [Pimephales promelas]
MEQTVGRGGQTQAWLSQTRTYSHIPDRCVGTKGNWPSRSRIGHSCHRTLQYIYICPPGGSIPPLNALLCVEIASAFIVNRVG